MPALNTLVKTAMKPIPAVITPKGRSAIDLLIAGAFLATAGLFFRRNKRAAAASLLCGGAAVGLSMLTDYSGRERKPIDLSIRQRVDWGMAAMAAAMPEFLNFEEEPERKFFIAQGVLITVANELTQFPKTSEEEWKRRRRAA